MRKIKLFLFFCFSLRLMAQSPQLSIQNGHSSDITAITSSMNGKFIATGGLDNTAIIWDTKNAAQIIQLKGHTSSITCVCFSNDDKFLLSGSEKGEVILWDISEGKLLNKLRMNGKIHRLHFSGKEKLIYIEDSCFKIINIDEAKVIYKRKDVLDFNVGRGNTEFYFAALESGKIKLEKQSIGEDALPEDHKKYVETKVFSRIKNPTAENLFINIQDDGLIACVYKSYLYWQNEKKLFIRVPDMMDINNKYISHITFIKNETIAITAGNGIVLFWNAKSGKRIRYKQFRKQSIKCIQYSDTLKTVLMGGGYGVAMIFDPLSGTIKELKALVTPVRFIHASTSSKSIFSSNYYYQSFSFNYSVIPFSVKGYNADFIFNNNDIKQLRITDRNKFYINNITDKKVLLKDKITRQNSVSSLLVSTLLASDGLSHPGWKMKRIQHIVISPDEQSAYFSTSKSGMFNRMKIKRIDLSNPSKAKTVSGLWYLNNFCFSEQGKYFGVIGTETMKNKVVEIYRSTDLNLKNISTFKTIKLISWRDYNFLAVSDSDWVAVCSRRDTIYVYSLSDGKLLREIPHAAGPVIFINQGSELIYRRANDIVISKFNSDSTVYVLQGHSAAITNLSWDETRNCLISSSDDGSIKFWNTANGKLMGTLFMFDKDYILLNPEGYFMSSRYGTKAIGYKNKMNYTSFEQFDIIYNRPDLVLKSLNWTRTDDIEILYAAYKKRLERLHINTNALESNFNLLPSLEIINRSELPYETQNALLALNYRVCANADPLKKIMITINDIPVFGTNGITADFQNCETKSMSLKLNEGENEIKVFAVTLNGFESLREQVNIKYAPQKQDKVQSKTIIISIGISEYRNKTMNLKYAVKDATDLNRYFIGNKNTETHLLTNEKATRTNILDLRKLLMITKPEDKVIVSFSGHGVLDKSGNYYLGTYEIDFSNPASNGLLYDDFMTLFDSIPARKKLVFIDACHSGELDKETINVVNTTYSGSGNDSASRGSQLINDESKGLNSFELMRNLFVNTEQGNGTIVISASSGKQFAYEGKNWENGVFTYCLLQAFKEGKADKNKDRKVSIEEMKTYIMKTVPLLTYGRQTPTFRKENYKFDWNIN